MWSQGKDFVVGRIVGMLSGFHGGISPAKSASVELSRMLGSLRCIQTLLAIKMSGSRKRDSVECCSPPLPKSRLDREVGQPLEK